MKMVFKLTKLASACLLASICCQTQARIPEESMLIVLPKERQTDLIRSDLLNASKENNDIKSSIETGPQIPQESFGFSVSAAPTDPFYQGGNDDMTTQWGLDALKIPQAWDYVEGNAYIAVIDLGIETAHPDLQQNFRSHLSYDFGHLDIDVDELAPNVQTPNEVLPSNEVPFGTPPTLVGHGTHVAGILAATGNNGTGIAGVCLNCNLMVAKAAKIIERSYTSTVTNTDISNNLLNIDAVAFSYAINTAVDAGAQVLNMSLGSYTYSCPNTSSPEICDAIAHAKEMDVVVVAASGNNGGTSMQYPASDPDVISVGAMDSSGAISSWSSTGTANDGPDGLDFIAPGVNILSTFYHNIDWIPTDSPEHSEFQCADSVGSPPGYGPCSGTSMAAPHIAGAVALLRSANPLLSSDHIMDLLKRHASSSEQYTNTTGYGLPDIEQSVKSALGTVNGETLVNRLTPLFSLRSDMGKDHFYTTTPQMAMSAMYGTMHPQPPGNLVKWHAAGAGSVPGYESFPIQSWFWDTTPYAQVYVFTTPNNPLNTGDELVPLYRLSYQGNRTGTNPNNVNHTYATSQAEVEMYENQHYHLDGIEGYIFPNEVEGTVKLHRRYNPELDDHAIFPETSLGMMNSNGYTVQDGVDVLGYVYLNRDTDNDGLIDGFEDIIGTDSANRDSDNDGITDGTEVNNYPYSDPLDTIPSSIWSDTINKPGNPRWSSYDFSEQPSDTSIVLSQMQSFNGDNAASLRMRNLTTTGIDLLVEEEQSSDTEMAHIDETVGLLGLHEGEILDSNGNAIGEAGLVTSNTRSNNDWKTLTFSRSYNNPVVLMQMNTFNGGHPSHIRLRNVAGAGAQYQIEEWEYLDGAHAVETIGYIVVEQGTHTLNGGKSIQAGISSTNHTWRNIDFEDMGGQPVVFSQSQTTNDGQAIVTRQREIVSNGFQVRLQEEEANDDIHGTESIGYIVIQ